MIIPDEQPAALSRASEGTMPFNLIPPIEVSSETLLTGNAVSEEQEVETALSPQKSECDFLSSYMPSQSEDSSGTLRPILQSPLHLDLAVMMNGQKEMHSSVH